VEHADALCGIGIARLPGSEQIFGHQRLQRDHGAARFELCGMDAKPPSARSFEEQWMFCRQNGRAQDSRQGISIRSGQYLILTWIMHTISVSSAGALG